MDYVIELTPSNKTKCSLCKELLEKGNWRFKVTYKSFKQSSSDYFHVECFLGHLNKLIDDAEDSLNKGD
jgi:hypothetical protein